MGVLRHGLPLSPGLGRPFPVPERTTTAGHEICVVVKDVGDIAGVVTLNARADGDRWIVVDVDVLSCCAAISGNPDGIDLVTSRRSHSVPRNVHDAGTWS